MSRISDFFENSFVYTEERSFKFGLGKDLLKSLRLVGSRAIEEGVNLSEQLVTYFFDSMLEFCIRDWDRLIEKKLTDEEKNQVQKIFKSLAFQIDFGFETVVWLKEDYYYSELNAADFDMNLFPFSEEDKMAALFLTKEEKERFKINRIYRFYKEILESEKIKCELTQALPALLEEVYHKGE